MAKIRNLAVLAAVGGLAILAIGWALLVNPQRSHADQLRAEKVAAESEVSSLRTNLQMLRAQAKQLPKVRARLAEIAVKIPGNPALPSLVRALTKAADDAGVDLTSISPATPVLMATVGASATGTTPPAVQVAQIGLSINVLGSYAGIEQFESNLENLDRALKNTSLSLAPGTPTGSGAAQGPTAPTTPDGYSGLIAATLNGSVFMTVDRPSAPATGSPTTTTTTNGAPSSSTAPTK